MIRILHVVSVLDVGGMESYIMNMYRQADRSQIQFDFLVHHKKRGVFEDEIESLGGRIYHTSLMDDGNLPRYLHTVDRLFSEHPEYRIVHGHLGSTAVWYLGAAERHGVPWRIMHNHCPSYVHSLKGYAKDILFRFSPRHANIYLACSQTAGEYMFKDKPFEVIPNGIDVARFRFSQEERDRVRRKLGLENKFVVGHVGRFYYEKNHEYLLKIFRKLKEEKPTAVLLLLGEGVLMDKIKEEARKLGLEDSVLFMGLIRDCAPYYHAMDAFVMPSLYEGLPLTGVEAQCSALPCLFSNTVSPEIHLTPDVCFLPIGEENIGLWSDALMGISRKTLDRSILHPAVSAFDSKVGTEKMIERYQSLWGKKA